MTMSLVAVFIPVLFMGGIVGRLLHEFAVTISVAILVSGFVSLSLTPMLCSRFLKPPKEKHGRAYTAFESFFDGMAHLYDCTLQVVLRHRLTTLVLSFVLLVATGYLFYVLPKGFIPSYDTGQLFGFTEAAQDISFDSMVEHQQALNTILLKEPAVDTMMSFTGGGFGQAGNTGVFFIAPEAALPAQPSRWISSSTGLRPKLCGVPGIHAFCRTRRPSGSAASSRGALYQFTLQGTDTQELYRWAPQIEAAHARSYPASGRQQRSADHQPAGQSWISTATKRLALGITPQQVQDALYTLTAAPGLHHLHARQRIPRDHRSRAAVSAHSRSAVQALHPLLRRATGPARRRGETFAPSDPSPSITRASCPR